MSDSGWLTHLGVVTLLAVAPFAVIACTSFAKVAVVLGITKNAIGGQGIIPVGVVTALAMVVTLFIMGPVIDDMLDIPLPTSVSATGNGNTGTGNNNDDTDSQGEQVFDRAQAVYRAISPPLIRFLRKNTPKDELTFFGQLDKSNSADESSVRVLLVAFASNELVEAFVLGVLILIPFLVVDLIVANTLTALGLATMPAITVALPMKLLLFIAADGWHLLINALILSYNAA